jgi:oligopeptidase B
VTKDDQERPFKVWRHCIEDKGVGVSVFEESDEAFYVGIGKSRSEKVVLINCGEL